MVLAEKCPNCGAFLPVRRAGVHVRRCEFCDLEVPGAVVEAPRLTGAEEREKLLATLAARRSQVQAAQAEAVPSGVPPSTWVPGHTVSADTDAARPAAKPGGGMGCALTIVAGIAGIVGLVAFAIPRCDTRPLRWQVDGKQRSSYAKRAQAAAAAAGGWTNLEHAPMFDFAVATLRETLPDGQLIELRLHRVKSDGRMDLTLGENQSNDYELRSPSRSKAPPGTPQGVDTRQICKARLHLGPTSTYPPSPSEDSLSSCRDPLLLPPVCTPAQIWQRALAAGAPAEAVADLSYEEADRHARHQEGFDPDLPQRGQWRFHIPSPDSGKSFHLETNDDCDRSYETFAAMAAKPPDAPLPRDPDVEEEVKSRGGSSLVMCLYRQGHRRSGLVLPLTAAIAVSGTGSLARVSLAPDREAFEQLGLSADKQAQVMSCWQDAFDDIDLRRGVTPHVVVVRLILETSQMNVRLEAPLAGHLAGVPPIEVE